MLLFARNKKSTPKKRIFRVPYAIKPTAEGNKRAVGVTSFYSRVGG